MKDYKKIAKALKLKIPNKFPCSDPEACPHFYNEYVLCEAYEQLQAGSKKLKEDSDPTPVISDALFLVELAQNDYMIDGNYLPKGERLLEISRRISDSVDKKGGD